MGVKKFGLLEKRFPKEIHVTIENLDENEPYLSVSEGDTAEDALTSTTQRQAVATYVLKEVREGKLEPVFSTIVG